MTPGGAQPTTVHTLGYARPIPPRRTSHLRQFGTLLLLALGVQLWIVLGRSQVGERRQILTLALAAACTALAWLVRPIREPITILSNRFSKPAPRTRLAIALAIALLSTAYLHLTASAQHRDFAPILHDEYAYLLQAKMLAAGHLWLPKHELADFFDSFHLITDCAYAAKYGPGTALFLVPAIWLHLPVWSASLLLSGVAVGLIYLLISELFDGTSGLLAALMLLSLGIFRRTSIMLMSQAPMLVLVLLAMIAFVQWRRSDQSRSRRRAGWMLLLGISVGWGAITRPVDALCVALPLALAILFQLRGANWSARFRTILIGLLGVAPFVALQLIDNVGITGRLTQLPWDYYAQRYDPADTLSRKPIDPSFRPRSIVPQKQQFYDEFTLPTFREKIGMSRTDSLIDRTTRTLAGPPLQEQETMHRIYGALPSPILIALLPVGLLGLCARRRALWPGLPLFLLIYANYTFFLPHYALAIVPAVIINVLAAKTALQRTWPRAAAPLGLGFTLGLAALAVTALPQLNHARRDQWFDGPLLRDVDRQLAKIDRPAIVLFKFDPERSLHEEPVYNVQTPWPDDAPIIRAHDLGDPNARLFAYYANRSPARAVYRYDEKTQTLTSLGVAADLNTHPPRSVP